MRVRRILTNRIAVAVSSGRKFFFFLNYRSVGREERGIKERIRRYWIRFDGVSLSISKIIKKVGILSRFDPTF